MPDNDQKQKFNVLLILLLVLILCGSVTWGLVWLWKHAGWYWSLVILALLLLLGWRGNKVLSRWSQQAKLHNELNQILNDLNLPPRSALNIPNRIDLCYRALELISRASEQELWADLQNELADCLVANQYGARADNLEQAIYHYTQALEVYSPSALPEQWADVQIHLANAYHIRIRGDRADNLEQAIHHYTQALEVYSLSAFPEQWAATQNNLAIAYSDRIRELRTDNLEQAIHHYTQALKVYIRTVYPEQWADIQDNLANAYSDRIQGVRADNIEQAIHHYTQALEVRTRSAFPEKWSDTQTNLANAYSNRVKGERANNLEQAIHLYTQALEVRTRANFPEKWADTQIHLANAYFFRIQGKRGDNIEKAIRYYTQALEVRTRKTFPEKWAGIQNNLAAAYGNRISGDRADNLEQAIHHATQALRVNTRSAFPRQWADTQDNLANAYSYRIRGDRADNLEQAILHATQALRVNTRSDFPEKWARTQLNLANLYLFRIRGDRADNLEQSIHLYTQGLEIRTLAAFPEQWALSQHNLANAYFERIRGDRADNLEQAIYHYTQALEVYSHSAFPEQWAMTQNDLANAYLNRIRGDLADNIEQAIHHYTQALEVRTRSILPSDYRQTQRNLGNLYFGDGRWAEAIKACQAAIAAGYDLLATAHTEIGRRAEIRETAQLYAHASYSLLQMGQFAESLLMLEHGKTRLLSEALRLADADLEMLPEDQQDQMREARDAVYELEAEMRLQLDTPASHDERELADLLRQTRDELNTLIKAISKNHPDFMPQGLDLPQLLALVPQDAALIAPLVTSQGSAVFMVPHGTKEVTEEHVIYLDEFKDADLDNLLRGTEENPGWLRLYVTMTIGEIEAERKKAAADWHKFILPLTHQIWTDLFRQVHEKLQALGVKSIILMPVGGLQLLPLHAAWRMEDGVRRYLLDDYDVVYAPSGYLLKASCRRAEKRDGRSGLVVGINIYADPNVVTLNYAVSEARVIAGLLETEPLIDAAATKEAIKTGVASNAYLHLSCHGGFDWDDPLASGLIAHDTILDKRETWLTLAEITGTMNLNSTRAVTLSACETSITDVRQSPDEYVGLPVGFLQAGAPAVISSLWEVDDRSTALLMERFYRNHLEGGMPLSIALREAQLWIRDATKQDIGDYYKATLRISKPEAHAAWMELDSQWKNLDDRPYSHPFFWAAFIFNGA